MTARESASPEHERLMGYLLHWMEQDGFKVKCAKYRNYEPCDRWKQPSDEHVPDARGLCQIPPLLCYGECKTADDIDNEHTKAQFRWFSTFMMPPGMSEGKECPFYIAIPSGSEEILQKVLGELDLLDKPYVKWRSF